MEQAVIAAAFDRRLVCAATSRLARVGAYPVGDRA